MSIIEKELQKVDIKQLKNRKILLMGRIEHVKQIKDWLCKQGISVEAILDNDERKQGLYMDEIPILAPESILCPFQKEIFIIIYSPKYWESMCAQFLKYGYREKEQIYVLDRPGLDKNIDLVREGVRIYQKLQKQYGENVQVFLANCPLGDYYLLGLYFHQYCELNQIDSYVVVGESKGIEKFSSMFQMEPAFRISTEECNALIRAWIFLGERTIHIKLLTLWQGAFRFNPCAARQTKAMTFIDTFKHFIYRLPNETTADYPRFSSNREMTKALFAEKSLTPAKTVLLVPYSYSIQSLPEPFWNQLAKTLRQDGFSVAVNIGEERERDSAIDAVKISVDFNQISDFMEYGGYAVGIRCGFFDITSQVNCRKVILYHEREYKQVIWNRSDMEFCSLKAMELSDSADEIVIADTDKTIETIVARLKEEPK